MSKIKSPDHPLEDCMKSAAEIIIGGGSVHQKFTCQGCKKRWTLEQCNTFHELGICPECSHETDITEFGCNYVALIPVKH